MRHALRLKTGAALALLFALGASCAAPTPPMAVCPPVAVEPAEAVTPLAELAAKAGESGTVRVIVRLAAEYGAAQAAMEEAQGDALALFETAGVAQAEAISPTMPFVVAEVTADQLNAMYSNPAFVGWMEDRIAFPTLAESVPLVQAPDVWALGGRGAGQAVAILDTGVQAAHPFLSGRVVAEACFSTTSAANSSTTACPNGQSSQTGEGAGRPCNASGCEHGTHVAGIAAGRGENFSGVAPDADIIAVQVFSIFRGAACGGAPSPCVASFTSDQIRGLDFVLQLAAQRPVASVNMSLGGGRSTTFCDGDLTKPVIDQLRAAGVATAIASGNDGFRDSVSFPGCISSAITVGATSKQDAVADFSNCGPQVDLHAPGLNINSSIPTNRFAVFSGTSMATPHVAGAFASLRSLHPDATVDQIESALESTGLDVGGRPRIRLAAAAAALGAGSPAEEAAVAEPTAAGDALAELAAMAPDQPVRLIVRVAAPAGAQGAALNAAIASAEQAARDAGASSVERLGSQPMLVVEATSAQARTLAQSAAVASVQVDRPARTQN